MFSKDPHETRSIETQLNPGKYKPAERCKLHPKKPVTIACTQCLQLLCEHCDLQARCEYTKLLVAHFLIQIQFNWHIIVTCQLVWSNC